MEIDSNNVAEAEKYAFLLGSALKNEDTDQFFSIYDSILPRDLPDSQLEKIKDQARRIADLPEEVFNNLVFKARNFSLAPAGTTMSCSESPTKKWVHHNDEDSEEDEGVGSARYTGSLPCGKSDTSSLYSINTTKISSRSGCESDAHKFDDDSGVCNSSKATNSIGSWSDQEASDYEGQRHFDYYPQVKIRSGAGLSLDYDEAHEVKSDQSSQDVNSPRSDISEGREMVTYSTSHNPRLDDDDDDDEFQFNSTSQFSTSQRRQVQDQDDFNTEEESDDDDKQALYSKRGYMPVYRESEYQPKFGSLFDGVSTSSRCQADVDKSINFSGLKDGTSPYSRHLSYSAGSEKVKIERNSYKKGQPPFGRGEEQLHNVGNSVGRLISNVPDDREVENMPKGRELKVLTPEDNSKKKKKKKKTANLKDDSNTDENGNPIEGLGLKAAYRQMRESPSIVGGTAGSNRQHTDYGTIETLSPNSPLTNKETEDAANKTQERKRKKKPREPTKLAQDVDNYIGNKTVEELLLLIDGQNASSKKSKKLSPNVTSDIPGKTPKPNKKNKDKKQKSPTPSNSIEEIEGRGDHSAQKSVSESQLSTDNMGNSSAKTDVNIPVENGDIEGIYCNKDKLTKPLLKEDRKDITSSIVADCNLSDNKATYCKESVKEKGGTKTNIKREAVSETIIDKKKSDKPKSSKVEKTEMFASKSEETLRVESSLTVKQKNAKNKKSKPLSPTVTVDNNLSSFDMISQSPPVINSISDDNLIGDNNFIFTDLDFPQVPKEDEFQVVGKKKKKVVKELVPQNNFIGNNKPHRRFDDKRTTPFNHTNRSPAPSTIQSSSPIETDPHARDLSPSAFPALVSGKGRQSLQDGRRNSTGDVPISSESLLKSHDDSDMESVKSLPATQGSLALDTMLSPRLNVVSYAKMAASSKQGSSSGERSSLESESDQSEHELKKACWKGSPTERRHSIGSSPEGVNKPNKNSSVAINSVATTLKGGSQENIIGEISVSSRLESTVNSECLCGDIISKELVEGKTNDTEQIALEELEFGDSNIDIVKVNIMPVQNIHLSSSVVPENTCPAEPTAVLSSNTKQPVADKPTKSSNVDLQTSKDISSSGNGSHSKSISPSSNVHKQDTPKAKVITLNNKKQKSVIFLDKPFEENPGSLGISFGFEMTEPKSFDSEVEPLVNKPIRTETNDLDAHTVEEIETPLFEITEASSFEKSRDNVTNLVPEVDNIKSDYEKLSKNSSSSSVIDTIDFKQDSSISTTESTDPLGKVTSQITRLNGVVSSPQGQNVKLVKESKSDDVNVNEVNSSVSLTNPLAEQSDKRVARANEVIVYYGEGVATLKKDVIGPSLTNGPTRYCGLITYVQEAELRSNFNIAEAASFLTKEWDRVRQMQDREPDNVKVHQN